MAEAMKHHPEEEHHNWIGTSNTRNALLESVRWPPLHPFMQLDPMTKAASSSADIKSTSPCQLVVMPREDRRFAKLPPEKKLGGTDRNRQIQHASPYKVYDPTGTLA